MTAEKIKESLAKALEAIHVEVVDDSAKHAGHRGAQMGGGHYSVLVVTEKFRNKALLLRHQMIYQAVSMGQNESIHALSIRALTPEEWKKP